MRSVQQIFDEMKTEAIRLATEQGNDDAIAMFNNISAFAVWKIMFYAQAFCQWVLEGLWENFLSVVRTILNSEKPHTRGWYRTKGINFQYGFPLIPDTDKFDNTGFTQEQIENSKVVKYSAVNETTVDNKRVLLYKVAGKQGDDIVPLTALQEAAFIAYMEEIRDAGVPILYYNREADLLRATVTVHYNALLLDENGNRLDGLGEKPVESAARTYPFNLDFNGEFSNAAFIDAIQAAYGVSDRKAFLVSIEKQVGANWQSVPNTYIPEAGYARFDEITINYIADVQN